MQTIYKLHYQEEFFGIRSLENTTKMKTNNISTPLWGFIENCIYRRKIFSFKISIREKNFSIIDLHYWNASKKWKPTPYTAIGSTARYRTSSVNQLGISLREK